MFRVKYNWNRYFICFGYGPYQCHNNNSICKKLSISMDEFNRTIVKHGGITGFDYVQSDTAYYFHNFHSRQDAEECLKTLEPYIILSNLTGD
jgi:hypothetical protein